MARRFHCTGPIEVVVGLPTVGAGVFSNPVVPKKENQFFLGTCEQHPITQFEVGWEQVPNDLGGTMVGLDKQFQGGGPEIIILDLNRFDYNVMNLIDARSHGAGATDGIARGAYKQQNGLSFQLWLYYTFFGTRVATAFPNMPRGVYYPCCNLLQDDVPKQGTKTQTKRIIIEADWAFFEGPNPLLPGGNVFMIKSSAPVYF